MTDQTAPPGRPRISPWASTPTHHSALEDLQGIVLSILLVALSLSIFQQIGIVTAGIAGLALIVSYATGLSVGTLFFLLNLPFYALAILRMGWSFTLKTFAAVTGLSLLVELQPVFYRFERIDPVYGTVLAGVLLGFGLLGMFRHRASLGGVGILALYLEDRFGWRAGLVQMAVDVCILATGLFVLPPGLLALSLVGAVVLNLFLAINHRPDRYIAR